MWNFICWRKEDIYLRQCKQASGATMSVRASTNHKCVWHCLFYFRPLSHKIWVMLNMSVFILILLWAFFKSPCVCVCVSFLLCMRLSIVCAAAWNESLPLCLSLTLSLLVHVHSTSITPHIIAVISCSEVVILIFFSSTSDGFQVIWMDYLTCSIFDLFGWKHLLCSFSIQGFEPEWLYTGENFGKVLTTLLAVNFATQGKHFAICLCCMSPYCAHTSLWKQRTI